MQDMIEARASFVRKWPLSEARHWLVLLSLLSAACQHGASRPPDSSLENDDSEAAPVRPKNSTQTSLKAPRGEPFSFEKQFAHVSKLRGLNIKGTISGLSVEPQELVRHVGDSVSIQTPPEALSGTEAMLVGLGAAPFDFNFRSTMLDLLGENLQGLYDPHLKMMLVRSGNDANRDVTLAHELVHALQDQHFDLGEIIDFEADDTDKSSALSCLAEGDATSTMFDAVLPNGQTALDLPPGFIRQQFSSLQSSAQQNAPAIIVRSLAAPYLDGVEFVHQLRKRGGFKEVDRVFRTPPVSTEQVLHLEKYDLQEPSIPVKLPAPPQPGWTLTFHDIWGEQSLRLLFEEWLPQDRAKAAAAGWGGDRISLFSQTSAAPDKAIMVHWHIVADTELDAKEMFDTFSNAFSHQVTTQEETHCGQRSESDPRVLAVKKRGRDVFLGTASIRRASQESGDCQEALELLQTQAAHKDPSEN